MGGGQEEAEAASAADEAPPPPPPAGGSGSGAGGAARPAREAEGGAGGCAGSPAAAPAAPGAAPGGQGSAEAAAEAARAPPRPGGPASPLQWLHETYGSQWKGAVRLSTEPGERHAPGRSHWVCTVAASGAVVVGAGGKNVTLALLEGRGEGRSKREAEQAAALEVYWQLVDGGWFDPKAPPQRKSGGPSRASRFITDSLPANESNPLAFLDVSVAGRPVGRIVLELFRYRKGSNLEQHAPLAVSNFLALCRGVEVGGRRLCYAGVPFTRVVPRFVVQAGDVVNRDGTGAAHVHTQYGDHFPDEGLDDKNYRHQHPFMLSSANLGLEHTNSSQFFITLAPAQSLSGGHTCFGKVLAGYGVVKEIEAAAASGPPLPDGAPPVPVVIEAAGELPPVAEAPLEPPPPVSAAGWPLWPEDQGPPPEGEREAAFRLRIADGLRAAGNSAYKQGDAAGALARYRQAARFLSWTSFKLRSRDGDVDLDVQEQTALWDAEAVLLCNAATAEIKLGRHRDAKHTCKELLRRAPHSPKALLRAAQARMGLGPGEFDDARGLLREALSQAQQQQLPTADILGELRRLGELQSRHSARCRSAFSAAFAAGLLHHPADDEPPRPPAPPPRRAGPVAPERVLQEGSGPVMVRDAWGAHPLVAGDACEGSDSGGEGEGGGRPGSYAWGLAARLARMGLGGGGGGGEGGSGEGGRWWPAGGGAGSGSSESSWSEGGAGGGGCGGGDNGGGDGDWAAAAAPAAAGGASTGRTAPAPQVPPPAGAPGEVPGGGEQEQLGMPEACEAGQAAAAGAVAVSVAGHDDGGGGGYGGGALGALPRRVPLPH